MIYYTTQMTGRICRMNFYSIDTLLRQSADWDIQYDEKKKCVIIDNYYENPEDVKVIHDEFKKLYDSDENFRQSFGEEAL